MNFRLRYCHSGASEGMVYEQWPNDLCAGDGFSSAAGFSPLRSTLPGRVQGAEFLVLGSVSLLGLRATRRARKFARHRSVSALATREALSPGFPRPHFPQHAGTRQRNSRLADLCRFRARAHRQGSCVVSRRTVRRGVGSDHLCSGFHHHRFVFGACFPGRSSAAARVPSKCIRCSICAAAFRPMFM